jgi:hypothetical protein
MRSLFHSFVTLTWTYNQLWLSMVLSSSQLMKIYYDLCTSFVAWKTTWCITFAMLQHHEFIGFMGSFQICAKSIISWVRIVYTQMSCII